MRAMLCKSYGPPETLVLETIPSPRLTKGAVRIAVIACGINFPDTLIIEGKYQAKPEFPFAPGAEISGNVTEVAEGVTSVKVGDRVLAMVTHGGLAEEVVVAASAAVPIPAQMDYASAAGFMMTYGTSYHALKQRARIKPGETLLVLGAAGGVGLAAVELGKAMGARVIAAASSDEKLAVAKEHGADELINYSCESLKDRVKELTAGNGVDVVYDPVGGDLFDEVSRLMNWNGRLLVIGFASGRIPQLPINLPLLKGYQLVGVFWGSFTRKEPGANAENIRELLQLFVDGKIRPLVSATFPLEKAAEAMYTLIRREAKGKVVVMVS
jgi:NADPH:quinone reductase